MGARHAWPLLMLLGCSDFDGVHDDGRRAGGGDDAGPPAPVGADPDAVPRAEGVQIYGAWHCSDDACGWAHVRDPAEFDQENHWLVDRGDGKPSVNLVILSFVNPLKLLDRVNDAGDVGGVPAGMTAEIVDYFTSHGIRVMLSIGGITYTDDWDAALARDGAQLGQNAADVATALGVGIEIDYENSGHPDLDALAAFIDAYRALVPYDSRGSDPAARLTIDLAAGTRWLSELSARAADWLDPSRPVLDYANAMVPRGQPDGSEWLEHIEGNPRMTPPIPSLAPAKLTGSIWLHGDGTECTSFAGSTQDTIGSVVLDSGMLGLMFWAAECEGTRTVCTTPPHTCEGGVGGGATAYSIPVPMGPLP
jgi:hypothetical protein